MDMAIYTTELLTDRDYNIPEGRLPLEYAVDQANKAKTHNEDAEVHVTAEEKAAWNTIAAEKNSVNITLGSGAQSSSHGNIAIGDQAYAISNYTDGWGVGSLAIGYKAKSSGGKSVAIGPDAQCTRSYATAVGLGTRCSHDATVAVGHYAKATKSYAIALSGEANGYGSICFGAGANTSGEHSIGMGFQVRVRDSGIAVIAPWDKDRTIQTNFYIIGANTPLANTYEDGEACLGYLVKNADGTIIAAGTRKLSELLTNNTTFAPASLDPEAEPPKVFLPTGATDPIEDMELPTDMEQPQELN